MKLQEHAKNQLTETSLNFKVPNLQNLLENYQILNFHPFCIVLQQIELKTTQRAKNKNNWIKKEQSIVNEKACISRNWEIYSIKWLALLVKPQFLFKTEN